MANIIMTTIAKREEINRDLTDEEDKIVEREAEALWDKLPDLFKAVADKNDFMLGAEMAITDAMLGNISFNEEG